MSTLRGVFMFLPAALLAVLAQAAFWVPSYDSQGTANASRLDMFVEASAGDARLLNPILHADTSSGRIVDLVFDGLLRVSEDLALEGSLAERWEVTERAFLDVGEGRDAAAMLGQVEAALRRVDPGLLGSVPRLAPAHVREEAVEVAGRSEPVAVRVRMPDRIEIGLTRVVPDLEALLRAGLGTALGPRTDAASRIDDGGAGVPPEALAALLPVVEHNPEITFWLRRDVSFHDGHPFDARDVAFTYDAIMDPRNLSPRRSSFEPIKAVTVLDTHRVRVTYKRLFSPAVNVWTIGILPRHRLEPEAIQEEMDRRGLSSEARASFGLRDSEFNRAPVGTGPFRFRAWASDELIHLSRNEIYHAGVPLYREYYYRILPDALAQELEFRAGAIDTYQVEPFQAARYRADRRFRSFSALVPGYTYIGYNLRKAPFSDVRVRRALGMAIDVDAIIRYALYGEGERVTGPYASVTQWYDPTVPALPFDPAAAEALLADAGYKRDADGWLARDGRRLEFNLITNNGNLRRKSIATVVQQAWQRIGVKCNVQLFEWAVFLKDFVNPGEFDAVVLGWRLDLDPDLFQIWHSSQTGPSALNFAGFKDARTDDLIEAIRREYSPDAQRRLAHALHARIAELQPYTFLFAPRATRVLDRKIVMRDARGRPEPVRAGGAGDLFFHMNRWQRLEHDPGL